MCVSSFQALGDLLLANTAFFQTKACKHKVVRCMTCVSFFQALKDLLLANTAFFQTKVCKHKVVLCMTCVSFFQALGDLLLPSALATAHPQPPPTPPLFFPATSSSPQPFKSSAANAFHAAGPQLLSPAQIASVAFCFGGGEPAAAAAKVGAWANSSAASSNRSGSSSVVGGGDGGGGGGCGGGGGGLAYHHVPLFRALASAALAPAVHVTPSSEHSSSHTHEAVVPSVQKQYTRDARCVRVFVCVCV